MASLACDPNGRKRILYALPDADGNPQRKALRLGKLSKRQAESIKGHIEFLLAAKITGTAPPDETSNWLASRDGDLRAKLVKAGLAEPLERKPQWTLGAFLDSYIAERTDVKPNTKAHLLRARGNLVDCWGSDRALDSITPADADRFRLWLLERMGENTTRRICGRAKQFFRAAHRGRLIADSPFADMKDCNVRANKSREYFVSRADAAAVLTACPNAEWQLIFALSRYAGLRCPSEHLALTWGDVDWERGRMTVRSPKTEQHEGKESRAIPIFPELRPYLDAVWEQAEPGAIHVITRYRQANANLRTQLERIIKRAGLTPWPKLFQNLRATRETELAESFPMHVVCEWIGNSQAVAAKHCLQVTEAHYDAAQNAAQSVPESRRERSQSKNTAHEKTPVLLGFASDCDYLRNAIAPPVGLEPTT